jgi:hypothetical protein
MADTMMTRGQRELIELLRYCGAPLTRENYIGVAWNDEPPADWGAEEEGDLPEFLQGQDDDRVFDVDLALAGVYDDADWE